MTDIVKVSKPIERDATQSLIIDRLEQALHDAREGRVQTLVIVTGNVTDNRAAFQIRSLIDFGCVTEMLSFIRSYFAKVMSIDPETAHLPENQQYDG